MVGYTLEPVSLFPPFSLKQAASYDQAGSYCLSMACNEQSVAIAGSNFELRLFELANFSLFSTLRGHSDRITKVVTCGNGYITASADRCIFIWDIRSQGPAQKIKAPSPIECISLNCNGNVIGAGTQLEGTDAVIPLWDNRNLKQPMAVFSDCHSDDVSQLQFHPSHSHAFLSGSVDGLVCLFDISSSMDEEEALQTVINNGSSVQLATFFGPNNDYCSIASDMQSYKIYTTQGDLIMDYGDIRNCSNHGIPVIDYIIRTHYDPELKRHFIVGGTNDGTIQLLHVNLESFQVCGILRGGHSEVIRDIYWKDREFILSCAEDGRLCAWCI